MNKQDLYILLITPNKKGGLGKLQEKGFLNKFPDEYAELNKINFPDYFTFRQKLFHYLKDDYSLEYGKCRFCGNRTAFKNLEEGYCEYCSKTCAQRHFAQMDKTGERKRVCGFAVNNNREKAKQTCLERYGVENPQQLKSVREKSLKTKHEKYGKNCEKIIEKTRQTKKEKYGDENYNNQKSMKKTNLEKYGAENVFASDYGKTKIKETCNERYGVDHPMQCKEISRKTAETKLAYSQEKKDEIQRKLHETWDRKTEDEVRKIVERGKKTKLELYGDENYSNRDLYRRTCIDLYGGVGYASEMIKEKCGDTLEKEYGVRHNMKIPGCVDSARLSADQTRHTEEYIRKMRDNYYKIYNEYIENGLSPKGGVSETELETYKFLKNIFGENVIPQYVSDVYPYNCDFYIKPLDLYIELNAHWTHGGHPFDENNENDLLVLNEWKQAGTKYYDIAVATWTIRDVEKRRRAAENSLNYLEIFSDDPEEIKRVISDYINKENK